MFEFNSEFTIYCIINANFHKVGKTKVGEMALKEFEILALNSHNFPTWATHIRVSVSIRGPPSLLGRAR